MARGRMIDRVIILSRKVNAVSEGAENLYYRLNVCADDFGRYHADPEIIKGQIYTKRRISLASIKSRLDELWEAGLLKFYADDGENYLEIVDFEKHQTFRSDIQRKAEYPVPKDFLQRSRNELDTGRIEPDTKRALKLSKVKINKVQVKADNTGQLFEEFWQAYPREGRFHKKACLARFTSITKNGGLDDLKAGFAGYVDHLKDENLNKHFDKQPMHMMTFMNKERYLTYKGFRYEPRL